MPSAHRPLVDFMIAGAQKCGTTALAQYLGRHPQIRMSSQKEPHLFDAADYSAHWTPEQIDERYRPFFDQKGTPTFDQKGTPTLNQNGTPTFDETPPGGIVRGEATPIYLFLPDIAPELKRYNPDLKLIVLLRDPVERAISHYYMEMNRDCEHLPLWRALCAEPWRLRRCEDPRRHDSAWRRHSYRRRGLYSLQLQNLYRHFDAAQVLLLSNTDLAERHGEVLDRTFEFLGIPALGGIEARTVFQGERGGQRHRLVSWALRLSYLLEFARMRQLSHPST